MRVAFTAVATLALMGCNFADSGSQEQRAEPSESAQAAPAPDRNLADSMASNDPQPLANDGNAMFPAYMQLTTSRQTCTFGRSACLHACMHAGWSS